MAGEITRGRASTGAIVQGTQRDAEMAASRSITLPLALLVHEAHYQVSRVALRLQPSIGRRCDSLESLELQMNKETAAADQS
jgi:hypothetical protein